MLSLNTINRVPLVLLLTNLLCLATATTRPAKRVPAPQSDFTNLTIQDICGTDASDCGAGWCCGGGTKCLSPSSPSGDYQCQDLIYTQLTIPAVDYSEFKGLVEQTSLNSLPDPLTSMGITLSTVLPTTPSDFSGLPTYSDNIVSSTSWATASLETPTLASAAVTRSTGGAAVATGVVGVGVWVGVIGMVVGG